MRYLSLLINYVHQIFKYCIVGMIITYRFYLLVVSASIRWENQWDNQQYVIIFIHTIFRISEYVFNNNDMKQILNYKMLKTTALSNLIFFLKYIRLLSFMIKT